MKLLLTGAYGQVGQSVQRLAADYGLTVLPHDRDTLDITDANAVANLLQQQQPELLLNAAAYTAVDQAERDQEAADAVNHRACAVLAQACRHANIPLLHISTDYVFDGKADRPYREEDASAPLGVYGQTKWDGEQAVRQHDRHIILRTAWVFSEYGNNFVKTMLRLGRERPQLGVVDDQVGGPTDASAIAATLLQIARRYQQGESIPWGTYHFCGAPIVSWYQFARTIFQRAQALELLPQIPELKPIGTADYPTAAQRPAYSALDCQRLHDRLGIDPCDWQAGLERVLQQLKASA